MLTLTHDAATAIQALTTKPDLPEQTGLRIASAAGDNGALSFAVSVADGPQPDDEVVEAEGARVFVDSEVVPALADKALDAEVDEQGQVRFQLAAQTL
ncbi:MAG: Fe-S cluster assembly protein HesB [Acidimicrobiales bacterium]